MASLLKKIIKVIMKGMSSRHVYLIFSFQGIGEPPLCLSVSIFFAIKEAIGAARKEVGMEGPFSLDSPATAERIRMACIDEFTKQVFYSNNFVSLLHLGSMNVSLLLLFHFLQA